jgi:hypothetical protein
LLVEDSESIRVSKVLSRERSKVLIRERAKDDVVIMKLEFAMQYRPSPGRRIKG